MTQQVFPSHMRLAQAIATTSNGLDNQISQQESIITNALTKNVVVQFGVIPSTPAGTPGPSSGARFGIQFFNAVGSGAPSTLQVQIDEWGWHLYTPTDVDYLSITGSPTGGTFTLTDLKWGTTEGIAYDATSAAVEGALNALPDATGFSASGGPLPASTVAITVPSDHTLSVNSTGLTGGTNPTAMLWNVVYASELVTYSSY